MKKCVNCGKESNGNFCVICGGVLTEELDELMKNNKEIEYRENYVKYNLKNKNIFLFLFIIAVIIIIGMGIYLIHNYNEQKNAILSLENQISNLNDKNWQYFIEKNAYQNKAEFLDENIVFVLDGYGNYYYTYDQVKQVTQGKTYFYWAYNKESAIIQGYKAWE